MATLAIVELEAFRNYTFSIGELNEEHFLVAGEQHDLETALEQLRLSALASPWTPVGSSPGQTGALLQSVAYLIPEMVREKLGSSVSLQTDAAHLPWEAALARLVVVRKETNPNLKTVPSEGPAALWAGCSHPHVFPWAGCALEACRRAWTGRSAIDTGRGLLTEAKAGLGFLVAGLSPKGELVLEDQSVNLPTWVPRQAQKARQVCRCLFLYLIDHQPEGLYRRADKAAKALLDLGVESVVVNFWQPDLERLPDAVEQFVKTLEGANVGQAFQALRESFPEEDARLSRWAFGLYGNPDLKGADMVPLRVGSSQSATTVPRFGKADYRLKISAGPEAGREIPIFSFSLAPGQRMVLGKPGLKRCQIEVQDDALGAEAFAFEWEGVEAYLVNLSKAPEDVKVDGLPVYGRLHLNGTQTIRSGASEFVFSPVGAPSLPSAPTSPPASDAKAGTARYQLVVVSGVEEDRGRRHPIANVSTVVGREGAFVLHDPAVSREHVLVTQRDGMYFVNHMEAGDLVLNGVPVEEESELRHGDRLVLSDLTSLLFADSTREGSGS